MYQHLVHSSRFVREHPPGGGGGRGSITNLNETSNRFKPTSFQNFTLNQFCFQTSFVYKEYQLLLNRLDFGS